MTQLGSIIAAVALASAGYGGSMSGPADARVAAATQGCGDLLGRMHKKPMHVRYIGCRYFPDRQGKPLVATYRLPGGHAASAEAYLVARAGLNRLKRSCCQWDAPAGQFKDAKGRDVLITMVSNETLVTTRAAWRRIPQFEVRVELMTEEI